MLKLFIQTFSIMLSVCAFIPLIRSYKWWVRVFDFPRLQFLFLSLLFLILLTATQTFSIINFCIFTVLLTGVLLDLYRVLPYTKLGRVESKKIKNYSPENMIKILSANIYIENSDYELIFKEITKVNPDLVLLVETDSKWAEKCRFLKKTHPYYIEIPKENTYGMLLFSKLPMLDTEVKYLTDSEVPSIFTKIKLKSGRVIRFIGLHPRPPRPQEGSSKQRDLALKMVSNQIDFSIGEPTIVAGDLNDVAWSHSSREFLRTSGLKDPRKGRGFFNSFHVNWSFLRFPLDHIFHSKHFKTLRIEILGDVGSDHYPIFAELQVDP